ncbi:sugar ABC transporter permease [Phytoactinopolyspora alkaliphila]|uniref:Sugar ABC transporter permease n=1 Tax=Phytoactinopolyspora alkaliphila TaxID=1783498 RepID=A0A6N9YSF1_9ACTN|nr:sugar ABC transporter permease [Phytoactinopolyspora alkaliphila]NED97973.1 sugar ABC transporter permease [Phytoactinopolyspora alkaliphila]
MTPAPDSSPAADRVAVIKPRPNRRGRPARQRLHSRQARFGLLFVVPATLYVAIFQLGPVLYGLVLSFSQYSPLSRSGPQFIGLDNYRGLYGDPEFARAMAITGRYVLQVLPPTVVIALGLALLSNRAFRGVGLFRTAMYVPHVISLTAVSMIWLWIYSDQGLVNEVLAFFGMSEQRWLATESGALNAASAMRVWKALGSNMVLLLAGLQTVPKDLYEAARVDGANAWQQFRAVTLPGLRPMLTYVVAMDIIYLAQGFTEIFVLTQGGPYGSTTTVNYLIYTEAFQYNDMGSASAMAFVLFAFIAGLSIIAIRVGQGRRP